MKRLKALLLAAAMVIGMIASLPANAEAASTTDLVLNVRYSQNEARAVLPIVNNFRRSNETWYWNESNTARVNVSGLSNLIYDYELEKVAMRRALEAAVFLQHTRPDRQAWYTAYPSSFGLTRSENLAVGYSTPQTVFEAWKEDECTYEYQGHRRAMLSSKYKYIGIGHVIYNGIHYWAQEFSNVSVNTSPTPASEANVSEYVPVNTSDIERIEPTVKSIDIKAGEQKNIAEELKVRVKLSYKTLMVQVDNPYTAIIGDPSVAEYRNGMVVGVNGGSTKLIISCLGKHYEIPVNVKPGETHYTLRFSANGGYVREDQMQVPIGSAIGRLPEVSREGYIFDGWYTSLSSSGQRVTESYVPRGNEIIYAKWRTISLKAIEAEYRGGPKKVGDSVDENDFNIYFIYEDGSRGTAYSFRITGIYLNKAGEHTFVISYGTLKTEVTINVLPNEEEKEQIRQDDKNDKESTDTEKENPEDAGDDEPDYDEPDYDEPDEDGYDLPYVPNTPELYRLYNRRSGEHFFTLSAAERDNLRRGDWNYEGIAWETGNSAIGKPVYRLFNRRTGEHFYTINKKEYRVLTGGDWNDEGIGWYSVSGGSTPVYRVYNPGGSAVNAHHYTTRFSEVKALVNMGWLYEGVGWYGR